VQSYGVADVEKLLRLSRSTIRSLISAGFVSPERGPRRAWRFSFQDLIVLRTAKALVDARVPSRRILRSLRQLRKHLPESMPLSGLAISAVSDKVVVREGTGRWQAESGQYVLEFGGDPAAWALNVIDRSAPEEAAPTDAYEWFVRAASLERGDPAAAEAAYREAIAADPKFVDARINLGRLLHDAKRYADAERVYRAALIGRGDDAVLLFNLGVLLDDAGRKGEAVEAYRAAVARDPALADGHYNLSLLYEELRRPRDAIRHMARYRVLTRG
jgi:tetratricopeptide (TPR) repeat protein